MDFERIGGVQVRLGYVSLEVQSVRFVFYSSLCIYRRRTCTYQDTAFTVLDRYDILYGGYKSDDDVDSGSRRRFLVLYRFRISTTL